MGRRQFNDGLTAQQKHFLRALVRGTSLSGGWCVI